MKEEDYVEHLLVANSHTTLLLFSSKGKVYWLKTYEIPEASRTSRGRPLINLLPLSEGERITAMLPVNIAALIKQAEEEATLIEDGDVVVVESEDGEEGDAAPVDKTRGPFVFMATALGTVKKTPLKEFAFQLQKGKIAIRLEEGDELVRVALTDGNSDVLLFASNGKAARFDENKVRSMGRTAAGVRGIRLADDARVVSLIVAAEGDILLATERGYGKRTPLEEFTKKGRATQGIIGIVTNERNGNLVGAVQVLEGEEIMLISNQGTLVRTRVSEVSSQGRNTQGVTLIKLAPDEHLVGLERVQEPSEEDVLEDLEDTLGEDALEKEMPVVSTEPSEDELLGGGGDVPPDVVPTDDDLGD